MSAQDSHSTTTTGQEELCSLACVASAKGKGEGEGGQKTTRKKGREKGALAATLLFSSLRLLSHYPIKMKPNLAYLKLVQVSSVCD